MVSTQLQACPCCGALLAIGRPVYSLPNDPLNDVFLCTACGLIYKPAYNFNTSLNSATVYSVNSWNPALHAHQQRLGSLVTKIRQSFGNSLHGNILDIGAGIGLLYEEIEKTGGVTGPYIALEPVPEIALELKRNHSQLVVLNGNIDDAEIPDHSFSAIFVCGVDYLFRDIAMAFEKISNLVTDDGIVAIQRNVFSNQTGYAAKPILTLSDLFSDNNLIRNWFHSDQYVEFLAKWFQIVDMERIEQTVKSGNNEFRNFSVTYICKKRSEGSKCGVKPKSYLSENVAILEQLTQTERILLQAQQYRP